MKQSIFSDLVVTMILPYLTVVEVPDPKVRLSTGYYLVSEGDGSIEVCAQVTTDQYDNTIQADYVTTPGSASGMESFP